MTMLADSQFLCVIAALFGVLIVASSIGFVLGRRAATPEAVKTIQNLNARINAWWVMIVVFCAALLVGPQGAAVLFAVVSFLALREYFALSHTLRRDHRVLLWLVFIILPVNYILVALKWYGLFTIFIPVYAFLWLQIRAALTGASDDFLNRTARIQWGMMVTVYFISYIPALLMLDIPGYSEGGQNYKLMLFLIIVCQASDILQYIVGKLAGKRLIAPHLSPNKTVEGFAGGILLASLLGGALHTLTPFNFWPAFGLSLVICLMGFAGGLVMSATKRDRGIKDFGTLLPGHGGMMDRMDSLCFAAPIFFHLTRYYCT